MPGSPTVLVGNMPALSNSSKLMCTWGGVIAINVPGQFTVAVGRSSRDLRLTTAVIAG